jgi:hypothetical protein
MFIRDAERVREGGDVWEHEWAKDCR